MVNVTEPAMRSEKAIVVAGLKGFGRFCPI